VAAVLTAAVHGLEMELSFPAGEKTLEEFAAFMQGAPLHELAANDLPAGLANVNPQQAADFVERNTVTVEAPPPPAESAPPPAGLEVREAIEELQQFKDAMGGAPHYPDRRPTHDRDTRTFIGIPREACQAWCKKVIKEKWIPQFFWKAVGRGFGLSETSETKYEEASLQLESLRSLADNRDSLARDFRSNVNEGVSNLEKATRLACHPGYQPAADRGGGMIRAMDEYLELFSTFYQDAKEKGNLQQFFGEALQGVCMEDRISHLQEYAQTHPVGDDAVVIPYDAGHDPNDTVHEALFKEMGAVVHEKGGWDNLTSWKDVTDHLLNTMLNEERQGEDGGRLTITREMIVSDDFTNYVNDTMGTDYVNNSSSV
jgi:hypothetical protein